MKIPQLTRVQEIELYNEKVEYWATWTLDGKIFYTGKFQTDYGSRGGRVLFSLDGKLVSFDGERIEIVLEDIKAYDYVFYYDRPLSVYRKEGKFIIGNKKYSEFHKKYGFIVLRDDKEIEIFTPFRTAILDAPIDYLVLPTHVSLLYEDFSLTVDVLGNVKKVNLPFHFVGKFGSYQIFYSRAGRVQVVYDEGSSGSEVFCETPPFVIGMLGKSIVIQCDNKTKILNGSGWIIRTAREPPLRSVYYGNSLLIVDESTRSMKVQDDTLTPDSSILVHNVKSVILLGDYPYVVHRNYVEKLSFVICEDVVRLTKRVIDGTPAEAELEECISQSSFDFSEPLVVVARGDNRAQIDTKLLEERIKSKARVMIGDIEVTLPIEVRATAPRVSLELVELKRAEGGHLVSSFDHNSVLRVKVMYELPSVLAYELTLTCCGAKKKVKISGKGEEEIVLPVFTPQTDRVLVKVAIGNDYRDEQIVVETVVKPETVTPEDAEYKRLEFYEGGSLYKIERLQRGEFVWDKIWIYPVHYYGVRFVKKGSQVTVREGKAIVKEPIEIKESSGKSVFLVPVDDPVSDVKVVAVGERLVIRVNCIEPAVIEAFYAGHVARAVNCGNIVFPLDPFYDEVVINVYSYGLVWSHVLKLNISLKDAMRIGSRAAVLLLNELKTYGLL